MRKITLDFGETVSIAPLTRREIHEYIAEKMDFPDYYGHNLDALYDCLTDISEPTAVGIAIPEDLRNPSEAALSLTRAAENARAALFDPVKYLLKVRKAFGDAEEDNPNLAVFDLTVMPEDAEE